MNIYFPQPTQLTFWEYYLCCLQTRNETLQKQVKQLLKKGPKCEENEDDVNKILTKIENQVSPIVTRLSTTSRVEPEPTPRAYLSSHNESRLKTLLRQIDTINRITLFNTQREDDLERSVTNYKSKVELEETSITALSESLRKNEKSLAGATSKIQELEQTSILLNQRVQQCTERVSKCESISVEDKNKILNLSEQIQIVNMNIVEHKREVEQLRKLVSDYKSEIARKDKIVKESKQKLETCDSDYKRILRELKDVSRKKNVIAVKLDACDKQRLSASKQNNIQNSALHRQVMDLTQRNNDLTDRYNILTSALANSVTSTSTNKSPLTILEELRGKISSQEGELESLKGKIEKSIEEHDALAAKLSESEQELTDKRETVSRTLAKLQSIVNSNTVVDPDTLLNSVGSDVDAYRFVVSKLEEITNSSNKNVDPKELTAVVQLLIKNCKDAVKDYESEIDYVNTLITDVLNSHYNQIKDDVTNVFVDIAQQLVSKLKESTNPQTKFTIQYALQVIEQDNNVHDIIKANISTFINGNPLNDKIKSVEIAILDAKEKLNTQQYNLESSQVLVEQIEYLNALLDVLRSEKTKYVDSFNNSNSVADWLRTLFKHVSTLKDGSDQIRPITHKLRKKQEELEKSTDKSRTLQLTNEVMNLQRDLEVQTVNTTKSSLVSKLVNVKESINEDKVLFNAIKQKLQVYFRGDILDAITHLQNELVVITTERNTCNTELSELKQMETQLKNLWNVQDGANLDVSAIEAELQQLRDTIKEREDDLKTITQERDKCVNTLEEKLSAGIADLTSKLAEAETRYKLEIETEKQRAKSTVDQVKDEIRKCEAKRDEFDNQLILIDNILKHIINNEEVKEDDVITLHTNIKEKLSHLTSKDRITETLRIERERVEAEIKRINTETADTIREKIEACNRDCSAQLLAKNELYRSVLASKVECEQRFRELREKQEETITNAKSELQEQLNKIAEELDECKNKPTYVQPVTDSSCVATLGWATQLSLYLNNRFEYTKTLKETKGITSEQLQRIIDVESFFNNFSKDVAGFLQYCLNNQAAILSNDSTVCTKILPWYNDLLSTHNTTYRVVSDELMDMREDILGSVRIYVRLKSKAGVNVTNEITPNETNVNVKCKRIVDGNKIKIAKNAQTYGRFFAVYPDDFTTWEVFTGTKCSQELIDKGVNCSERDWRILDSVRMSKTSTNTPPMFNIFRQVSSGYHIIVFGFGASGSGKTHTLVGAPPEYPRGIVHYCFEYIQRECSVKNIKVVNIFEDYIYQQVFNLNFRFQHINVVGRVIVLYGEVDSENKRIDPTFSDGTEIPVHYLVDETNDFKELGLDDDLKDVKISEELDQGLNKIISKIEQYRVHKQRQRPTLMNERGSSRSHLFIRFKITFENNTEGYITFVDTAGKESPYQIYNKILNNLSKNNDVSSLYNTDLPSLLRNDTTIDAISTNKAVANELKNNKRDMMEGVYINESLNHLTHYLQVKNGTSRQFKTYDDIVNLYFQTAPSHTMSEVYDRAALTNVNLVVTQAFNDTITRDIAGIFFNDPRGHKGKSGKRYPSRVMIPHLLDFLTRTGSPTKTKYIMLCGVRQDIGYCDVTQETLKFAQTVSSTLE